MLQRITALEDPRLPRVLRLRAALDALPLSGAGLPRVSIGRADGTTFRLGCSTDFPVVVSRHHASVSFDGEDFRLEDDDACNGTYVNEVALPRHGSQALRVGDVVSFGGAATFSRLGVVLHNPFRFVFVNDLEAAPEPAAAAEGVTAAVPAPVPPAPAPAAVAAPVAAPLAGRRRARENDTSPQPPATRRRTAAAAAAAAAAAQAAAAAATAALAAAAPPMSAGLRSTLERFARFAGGAHPGQQREAAPRPAPPLPTFEPLAVAPFPGDTAAELAAGISAESQCSICYELYVAPHATACSHIFCGECITKALQLRPDSCPECRGKAGAPVYVRKLDALLCAAVEPRLSEQEAQERQRRKRSWQDMQVAKAVAARDAAPARGVASVAYRPLQRGSGLMHGPAAALPDAAAPDGEPDVVAWRVAVVAGGARLVCHACFGALQPGDVRVLREVTAPEPTNGTFARPQLPRSRQFFHPGCCPAGCPPVAELQGVAALTAPERAAATAAMEAAAAARQQPAPAAQAAPGSRRRIGQLRRAGIVVHARWQQ